MEKDYLMLRRASTSRPSGEWKDDDFDVILEGVVVGPSSRCMRRRSEALGCGRSPSATMKTARPRTATPRLARTPWLRSRIAGGGSEALLALWVKQAKIDGL